ncbi:N-acetylmuramoyl-L-alanine amidase [Thermomonas sp.]|uniref:N-acetylmuramoyl-L-alanine amidase n=1 Tax=Thermomonas sp. TaxID=1971895 RepID=UPI0035B27ED3
MRLLGNHRDRVVPAAVLLVAFACGSSNAAEIKQLRIETGATGTRAELHLDKTGEYRLIPLSNPERLAVDFPDSHLARGLVLPPAVGMVKAVRTGQPVPGTVRVVFDLAGKVKAIPTTLDTAATGAMLVLEWPGDGASVAATAAATPAAVGTSPGPAPAGPAPAPVDPIAAFANRPITTSPATSSPSAAGAAPASASVPPPPATVAAQTPPSNDEAPAPVRPALRPGMRPLVVAIDAGHGGQDPGAHGPNGTREKDVTLAIARELARQVNATPGLKAFLTRDSDVYIPLNLRARRASANQADIFLSIHADAAENRGARGSSVYVLSTRGASSQRARWLADKENAADIIGGERVRVADNTLTSVLLDLTQSGNMKASEDAAEHVLGGLKRVGNNHKPDVERANFAVLRTSDKMPAMLVETAFISNPDEEKRLADPAFQRTLANAILDGIDRYFSRQPPPGTLYAARAQAKQSAQASVPERTLELAAVGAGGSP